MYAGQYQPKPAEVLAEITPPAYVAVTGKPRTYETDSGDINVSIRPESISIVDASTRQRWIVETASHTLDRIRDYENTNSRYVKLAKEKYTNDIEQYKEATVIALEGLDEIPGNQDRNGEA